jgi:hypothetical protein
VQLNPQEVGALCTPGGRLLRAAEGRRHLEILGKVGAALAARHALYDLLWLAAFVLAFEAKIYPTLIAAVRCLVGENFGGCGAYT